MTDTGQSSITVLGVPFDAHSSYLRGPAEAPPLIRDALYSDSANLWSETGVDLGADGVLHIAGDLMIQNSETAFSEIRSAVAGLLESDTIPLILGGDHAITYPVLQAFSKKYPRIHVLHFDAHPDLYDSLDGDRLSHACPFARVMEDGLCQRLVQVGVRTLNGHQRAQAERFGVEIHAMKDWTEDAPISFDTPVYLSFDVDALDPAFAPGVSHFEPGGLSTRQALSVIQRLEAPAILGADVVEFNPRRDASGMTAMVCAKIVKEIAGKIRILSSVS